MGVRNIDGVERFCLSILAKDVDFIFVVLLHAEMEFVNLNRILKGLDFELFSVLEVLNFLGCCVHYTAFNLSIDHFKVWRNLEGNFDLLISIQLQIFKYFSSRCAFNEILCFYCHDDLLQEVELSTTSVNLEGGSNQNSCRRSNENLLFVQMEPRIKGVIF